MKHEGDGLADTSTGRTKMGEALNRALAYFEAALYFIMSGYVMEVENNTGEQTNFTSISINQINILKNIFNI